MICPHCGIGTRPLFREATFGSQGGVQFNVKTGNCSECNGLILNGRWASGGEASTEFLLFPLDPIVRPIPAQVPTSYADDFRQACAVLDVSPKASAALSRRLLQQIIWEKAGIKKRNLNEEIDAVIEAGNVSSNLAEDLDMIRTVGNFAAHPIKSEHTGEVVTVEPGEAEALLDVLEQVFDHYFVRPAKREAMQARINQKLAEAGKPFLKGSSAAPSDAPNSVPPPHLRHRRELLPFCRRGESSVAVAIPCC